MSSSVATPPLAMTGIVVLAAAASPARSGPPSVPSRPMSVITNAAGGRKQPERIVEPHPAALRPTVHGQLAVAVIETDRDRKEFGRTLDERWLGDRRRPHHGPRDSEASERFDIADGPHSPAALHLRRSGDGVGDRRHPRPVHRIAREGSVEIDDVDPRRPGGRERCRDRRRIVAVDGLGVEVASREAHDTTAQQVDRRVELDGRSRRGAHAATPAVMRTKLPSRARPL